MTISGLRKKRKIKSCVMAEYLGLTAPAYSDMERGRRRFTAVEAAKLCRIFGVRIEEIDDFNDEQDVACSRVASLEAYRKKA